MPGPLRPLASAAVSAFVAAMMMTAPADAACLSQGEARRAVASGEALRLSEVRGVVDGDIVKAELCERRGRLVYRLTVIRGGGAVSTVVVDAATGEVLR